MNVVKSYNNWRQYRTAVAELSGLSNRSLADLGIARADIRAVARKAAQSFPAERRPPYDPHPPSGGCFVLGTNYFTRHSAVLSPRG